MMNMLIQIIDVCLFYLNMYTNKIYMVIHDYVLLCMIKNCSVGLHHGKQRPIF